MYFFGCTIHVSTFGGQQIDDEEDREKEDGRGGVGSAAVSHCRTFARLCCRFVRLVKESKASFSRLKNKISHLVLIFGKKIV